MTDQRDALKAAIAFALVFVGEGRNELRGASPERRREAATELYAALENLEIVEEA